MLAIDRSASLLIVTMMFAAVSGVGHAQQWNGPANAKGAIWRPGNVAIGVEPTSGEPAARLELKRPLTGDDELLFSARIEYKGATSERFEVDTRRAYAGGARSKASVLPADYDLAVHRSAAIAVNNVGERIPSGYALVVGGKILAEEVRIKLVKDWADYVFAPDYPLQTLPEIERFVRTHQRLPGIPSAAEVGSAGIEVGEMQSQLLQKIEELTLHLIEQHKTIESLRRKVEAIEGARVASTEGR